MVRPVRRPSFGPSVGSSSSTANETPSPLPGMLLPERTPSMPGQEISAPTTKRPVRGRSRGIHLKSITTKGPLPVHIDPEKGRLLERLESAKLSSELGQISRGSLPVPKKWKDLDNSTLMVALDKLDKEELNKQDPSHDKDEEVDRITFYKHCHYSEAKGWTSPKDKENWEEMERQRAQAIAEGREVDTGKIVDGILKKRSRYVAGLGYGPRPVKYTATTSKIKQLEIENAELKDQLSVMQTTLNKHAALLERCLARVGETSQSVDQSAPSSWST